MTDEKEVQIALGTYLSLKWKERCELCEEGRKLRLEGSRLLAEADELYEEDELRAGGLYKEGNKLYEEGNKLHKEGNKLYFAAAVEIYGTTHIAIHWQTGEVFR